MLPPMTRSAPPRGLTRCNGARGPGLTPTPICPGAMGHACLLFGAGSSRRIDRDPARSDHARRLPPMTTASRLTSTAWLVAATSMFCALGALAFDDAGVSESLSLAGAPDAGAAAVAAPSDGGTGLSETVLAEQQTSAPLTVPSRLTAPPIATVKTLPRSQDLLAAAKRDGDRLFVKDGEEERSLTIQPMVQARLEQILKTYETPYAAVVAIEPRTGRVLAMAEHSQVQPSLRGLPVKAVFPAASIFKIVTATALLDKGLTPQTEECTHGGKRRVTVKHLADSSRDRSCMTLSDALAFSANGVFAKLTYKNLDAAHLRKWAEAFHFNKQLSFPVPTDVSLAAFPSEPLELAQTGAGFGDVYLSPLHGAALAAVAANGGVWQDPILFDDQASSDPERVMSEERAAALTQMLEETVTDGTARRIFRERGFKVVGAVGKTGSLADRQPFRDYSWFVGFAPKNDPQVAVAAVIVNDPQWRIRATWLGREAMRITLEERARQTPAVAKAD